MATPLAGVPGQNMRNWSRLALPASLLVAAVIAVVFGARSCSYTPPEWVNDTLEERIDSETLEIVTLSHGEWERLGKKKTMGGDWAYRNRRTGKYTMVTPIICGACGAKIPLPVVPPLTLDAPPGAREEQIAKIRCPVCGKPPFPLP